MLMKSLTFLMILAVFYLSRVETSRLLTQKTTTTTTTNPLEDQFKLLSEELIPSLSTDQKTGLEEGGCNGGLESEEECLIRRSMAAHADYIYTQDIHGIP
ncbi:hypothetical protein CsatA_015987 [Cannabis sativa]